jgi:cell division initiation protein
MFLTPVELQHQHLGRRGRGYDRDDVERLLEHAAASYEQVWRERDELRSRVTELEEKLGAFGESERFLNDILVTAQRAADEVLADAKKEAERLREAQAEADHELEEVCAEIKRLRSLADDLRSSLNTLLNEGLEAVADGASGQEALPAEALAEVLRPKPAEAEGSHG